MADHISAETVGVSMSTRGNDIIRSQAVIEHNISERNAHRGSGIRKLAGMEINDLRPSGKAVDIISDLDVDRITFGGIERWELDILVHGVPRIFRDRLIEISC